MLPAQIMDIAAMQPSLSKSPAPLTPRLLIYLAPNSSFTAEKLQNEIPMHVVEGTDLEMQSQINSIDRQDSNHLIIVIGRISPTFVSKMRYASITLSRKYSTSIKRLKSHIAELPITEADLPHVDPYEVGKLYDLMMKVDCIFNNANIQYWATCGTCLGAVRHQGLIPWDDDLDIALFHDDLARVLALEDVLASYGLALAYHPVYDFYKIFPVSGEEIFKGDGSKYPWKYPFIDLFFLEPFEGKYTYTGDIWKKSYCEKDFFWPDELTQPLQRMPFGPLSIPVSHDCVNYVSRMYGNDWKEYAYASYWHRMERNRSKVRVNLINCYPPKYIMP